MQQLIREIETGQTRSHATEFGIGDSVRIHFKIIEGRNERTQVFEGTCIARKGSGVSATFTVRKISYGVGVERVFPLHSPKIAKIEVSRRGRVRRAKLFYLRDRVGKAAKVPERRVRKR